MSEAQEYVIRRGGGFYRPKAAGYTLSIAEAGRWSADDAYAYQLGVEGVTVHHVSEFKPDDLSVLLIALRRIKSLEPKNVPKYAQQIASEALARVASP